jgi:hypothetical protein
MNEGTLLRRFIEAIVEEGAEHGRYTVVRAALSAPDTALIVYRWGAPDMLFGRIYRQQDLYEIFSDDATTAEEYAQEVVTHDFEPPPGAGIILGLAWEASLGVGGQPVHWCDVTGDLMSLHPTLIFSSPENVN